MEPSPNPFNSTTTIRYELPHPSNISLEIYNLSGQKMASLINGFRQAGVYSISLSANDLPSGLYFIRLNAYNEEKIQRIVLMK